MAFREWIVLIILLVWFLAILLNQWKGRWTEAFRKGDVLRLIPTWHLFAPSPARMDYFLERRWKTAAGQITPWKILNVIPRRKALAGLWNPNRRVRKVFTASVKALMKSREKEGNRAAGKTLSHDLILNYARAKADPQRMRAVQFRLCETRYFDQDSDYEVVFTAPWSGIPGPKESHDR